LQQLLFLSQNSRNFRQQSGFIGKIKCSEKKLGASPVRIFFIEMLYQSLFAKARGQEISVAADARSTHEGKRTVVELYFGAVDQTSIKKVVIKIDGKLCSKRANLFKHPSMNKSTLVKKDIFKTMPPEKFNRLNEYFAFDEMIQNYGTAVDIEPFVHDELLSVSLPF